MSLNILATGDIHIGRRPTRIPNEADASRFSCANMWQSIVEEAIRQRVDLVALSGDVVDHENRFFEATGPLENGLRRLAEAGIAVYAVAGNHDYDVLPRIVDELGPEHLHLLGRGGRWESAVFERNGEPLLYVHGWSFPAEHVATSPLAAYDLPIDDHLPTLALLHADLDASGSRYAPVSRSELKQHNLALWLLGHQHKPDFFDDTAGPPILYPGSPQAMDPGETGMHGPWLVEVHGPRSIDATKLPMSKVHYKQVDVNLEGAADEKQAQDIISRTLSDYLAQIVENGSRAEQAWVRARLIGRTAACRRVGMFDFERQLVEDFQRSAGSTILRIDRVTNDTRPPIDLVELAEKRDPPGRLARILLALDDEHGDSPIECNEDVAELIRDTQEKMAMAHRATAYVPVRDEHEPAMDDAREMLMRQGMLLLETLRDQERKE